MAAFVEWAQSSVWSEDIHRSQPFTTRMDRIKASCSQANDLQLNLLKALIYWALNSSEAISTMIKDSYKNRKPNDDSAVPIAVQCWGRDGDKRQYWLIEGQNDTNFRIYRESNPTSKPRNIWRTVAGNIDEVKILAEKLEQEDSQLSRRLGTRIKSSIPRFEAGEEVTSHPDPNLHNWYLWANDVIETTPPRVSPAAQGTIHETGVWILTLRRSHSWQEDEVHFLR
jgi:hypothetical protein